MTDSSDDGGREALVAIMALLDNADHRFHAMGGQQMMSVGPVLSDLRELREEVVERGKGYGILPESATVAELRHEASKLQVEVSRREEGDGDGR